MRGAALIGLLALAGCQRASVKAGASPDAASRDVAGDAGDARDAGEVVAEAGASSVDGGGLELPRGGRAIFPRYRLVGYCGTPGAPELGKLRGRLANAAKELAVLGEQYADGREPMPVFELIAVIAQGAPGKGRKYRRRVSDAVVDRYLAEARAAKGLLVLDVQPGHSSFLEEVRHFERYLREPDVGVALDPEWAMSGAQKPGASFGQTTGAVINEVGDYLSGLVEQGALPEKLLVFHQVNDHVLRGEDELVARAGVVLVKSVDGLGPRATKIATYRHLVRSLGKDVHPGFKLFFEEDARGGRRLMTPAEVLALSPQPEFVLYE